MGSQARGIVSRETFGEESVSPRFQLMVESFLALKLLGRFTFLE